MAAMMASGSSANGHGRQRHDRLYSRAWLGARTRQSAGCNAVTAQTVERVTEAIWEALVSDLPTLIELPEELARER
jgi:hypothetical protein